MRIQKRGSHARTASSHGTATLYLAFINKPTSLSLSHARAPSLLLALSTCPFCPSISFCLSLSPSIAISLYSLSLFVQFSVFYGSNNSNGRLDQKEVRSSVPASSHPSLLILDSSLQFASPTSHLLHPSISHRFTTLS